MITGIALSFICPAIGTPIGIYVYGGLNGSVSDMLVMSLVQGGKTIFQASFLRNVASNLIDKIGTCIIGCLLIKAMPMRFMDNFKKEAYISIRYGKMKIQKVRRQYWTEYH